ncbi:M23 family metallopeptidase [Pedobacter aquatilis]|uniref:M23 family metallopeptidase n=1 Tax=Pedobacter aquatilis TaxID=351343 RepID=UPI0025B41E73|nr:M23 family metallopeptidase [Pedobacter aquatilis]MDN3586170.1 M23 family metallopeptidase [Pedobacter aquatilis]
MKSRIKGFLLLLLSSLYALHSFPQFALPLAGFKLNSAYGMRFHPLLKDYRFHSGIDLSARYEPVYSIFSGVVTQVGEDKIIGKYVKISQGDLQSIYGHLSAVVVEKGELVFAGEAVGISGNSGRSTGPHLHLSIKIFEKFVNPLVVIKALLALNINNRMEQNFAETDKYALSVMMLLLAENGSISLSAKQAEEYGVDVADHLPIEQEGGEDAY